MKKRKHTGRALTAWSGLNQWIQLIIIVALAAGVAAGFAFALNAVFPFPPDCRCCR